MQLSPSLSITCTCCYDEIKGTQDLKIYSHADSQILSVVCCLLSVVCSLFSALMLILSLLCLHCTHSVARWVAQLSGALQVIASSPEAAPAGLLRNLGLYRDGLAAYRARR